MCGKGERSGGEAAASFAPSLQTPVVIPNVVRNLSKRSNGQFEMHPLRK